MEFTSVDRADALAEFGDTLTAATVTYPGVFSRDYVEALDVDAATTAFVLDSTSAAAIDYGDTVTVKKSGETAPTDYTVKSKRPDSAGFVALLLAST